MQKQPAGTSDQAGEAGQGQQGAASEEQQSQGKAKKNPPPQPKRILGVMPNYRAVSAGEIPPMSRDAFMIATRNSFDYSAFIFTGITSLLAEGTNTHLQLGAFSAFWGTTGAAFSTRRTGTIGWTGRCRPCFARTNVITLRGEGRIMKRGIYAASHVLITRNYHGKNSFNASEIVGLGASQAISLT